jgi:Protein of unknown function (DUF4242)
MPRGDAGLPKSTEEDQMSIATHTANDQVVRRRMNLYAIRRRDFWGTPEELQATAAKSAQVGDEMADDVRWIRTYVVQEESGKLGTVCLYEGTSPEKVREQAERTGMPADEITLVAGTVIVRPDPVPATA